MPLRGDRLRERREQKGLTQRELSELCDITLFQISRYETGKSSINATALEAIARNLNTSVDYLLGLSDQPTEQFATPLLPEQKKLLKAYESADWSTILDIVSARLRQAAEKSDE